MGTEPGLGKLGKASQMEEPVFELTLRWMVRINQTSWGQEPGVKATLEKRLSKVERKGKGPDQKQGDLFRNLQADQYLRVKGEAGDGTEEIKMRVQCKRP